MLLFWLVLKPLDGKSFFQSLVVQRFPAHTWMQYALQFRQLHTDCRSCGLSLVSDKRGGSAVVRQMVMGCLSVQQVGHKLPPPAQAQPLHSCSLSYPTSNKTSFSNSHNSNNNSSQALFFLTNPPSTPTARCPPLLSCRRRGWQGSTTTSPESGTGTRVPCQTMTWVLDHRGELLHVDFCGVDLTREKEVGSPSLALFEGLPASV